MLRRLLLPALFAAALLALAVSQSPAVPAAGAAPPATAPAKSHAQIRGFSIQLTDPKGIDSYMKAVDDLAGMGCTWVNFVIAARTRASRS